MVPIQACHRSARSSTNRQRRGSRSSPTICARSCYIDVDWRRPLNARNGGWYRAEVSRYDDRQGLGYSFDRLDIDVRQFVSFLSERRVLVGRVAASTSSVEPEQQVPFYVMPTLGGKDTLRGFHE